MTENDRKEIVKLTTERFVACQRAAQKEKRSRWLHDTRQLMKHYNTLNEHSKKAVATLEEALAFDDLHEESGQKKICVETIKTSSAKTFVMMQHVNSMLGVLKNDCKKSGRERKYRIFRKHFIDKKTFKTIALEENVDERTAYRDTGDILETLSVLLFGIEELTKA